MDSKWLSSVWLCPSMVLPLLAKHSRKQSFGYGDHAPPDAPGFGGEHQQYPPETVSNTVKYISQNMTNPPKYKEIPTYANSPTMKKVLESLRSLKVVQADVKATGWFSHSKFSASSNPALSSWYFHILSWCNICHRRSLKGLATQGRRTHTVVSSHWAASTMALAATTMAALRCPRDGLPTSSILSGSSEPRKQF